MSKDLRQIAQELAELHLESYDFINVAENQDEWGLTDDEAEEVWEMVIDAQVRVQDY